MQKFLSKSLVFLSLLIISACQTPYHSGYRKADNPIASKDILVEHYDKLWFNTHIEAFGKELSGILVIKNKPKNTRQMALVSPMGMTYFEVEQNDSTFEFKKILPFLDKTNVKLLLQSDIELLLAVPDTNNQDKYFEHKKLSRQLIRSQINGRLIYFEYGEYGIVKKELCNRIKIKTSINYEYQGRGLPQTINILHHGLPISWQLSPIKSQLKEEKQ
ncbi:MAG: hypothetical protein JXR60_10215 [Bacteroidales bacterium]|nr:hypothetical protein [Bacteroidales bacterium]